MFEIKEKVALVTGGASGIGLATARQLLANGARGVVLADINPETGKIACKELAAEFGKRKVIFVETDISDKKSFEDAFKCTISEFRNIDILVNNAGSPDETNYEDMIAVNLTGTVHGTILALEQYIINHRSGPEGVIINTASTAGCHVSPVCHFVYGTPIYGETKSAVLSLVIGLGNKLHYERTSIKVLAIAPGMTMTNMGKSYQPRNNIFGQITFEETKRGVIQSAEFLAKNLVNIIREKPSGTIWICENNEEAYEYNPSLSTEHCYN